MSAALNSAVISLDSPISGWDAFNSLDNMPPTAAIILDNMIPGAGACESRKGSVEFADLGTALPVETVASFNSNDEQIMLASSNGGIWEIDSVGTPTAAPLNGGGTAVASTYSNSRWQYSNFRKIDETGVLILCNGVDTVQVYNDPGTGYELTDLDSTGTTDPDYLGTFIGCVSFKGRMYYWEDDDNAFWYAAAGSYQGVFEKFDLGSQVKRGGKLVLVTTWTTEDGSGSGDNLVFVFSTGETLIYRGDDPGDATAFELAGRYFIGEPLSIRGSAIYGSDTIVMTKDGYVSLSTVVQQGKTSDVPAFSRLIHAAVTNRTDAAASLFGWDVELYPADGLFIFNVPTSSNSYEQHVMNTVTQRWCRFIDLEVNNITIHDDNLYGGANDGTVQWLLEGTDDNGAPITCTALYAFNYFDNPGYNKHVVAAQILSTNTDPKLITVAAYPDFQVPNIESIAVAPSPLIETFWDVGDWDTYYWSVSGSQYTTKGWQNVSGYGYSIALLVRFAKINETSIWRSTSIRYINAGAQ